MGPGKNYVPPKSQQTVSYSACHPPERDRSSGVLGKHVILEDTAVSRELGNLGFKADPACFSWSLFNADSALQWAAALREILGTGYFVVKVLM